MKISFCAIVKNESKNLERCLASVKPFVDEMIVVDTGSTDDTVAIAKRHGATIHYFEWCNDFSAARNYANSLATGDWILTLDADEELLVKDKECFSGLTEVLDTLAYTISLRDIEGDASSFGAMRLFRNVKDIGLTQVGSS